ncbi:TetR/AcrR family transcriptional regulator [Myxococcota bacterium]|nr:TetR/AcrR family transcriptional regulator [Myxococcota bacterium]
MSGLRAQNKADKEARIREAAWALFAERGFEGATVREIAQRAGVAQGTVFVYAKDKEDLLAMLFADRLGAVVNNAFQTLPPDAELLDALLHIFSCFMRFYEQDTRLARSLVRGVLFLEGPAAERMHQLNLPFLFQMAGLFEAAQARGLARPELLPLVAAANAFAAYFMALASWLNGLSPDRAAAEGQLRLALEHQLLGVLLPSPETVALNPTQGSAS